MKCLLVLATLLTAAVLLGAAAESTAVTYADHEKVDKGGSLATAPDYTVSVNRRTAAGRSKYTRRRRTFFTLSKVRRPSSPVEP